MISDKRAVCQYYSPYVPLRYGRYESYRYDPPGIPAALGPRPIPTLLLLLLACWDHIHDEVTVEITSSTSLHYCLHSGYIDRMGSQNPRNRASLIIPPQSTRLHLIGKLYDTQWG